MGDQDPATLGVFVNQFVHTLDPKRRLTIPSQFRDQVAEPKGFFSLPGLPDQCLWLYPAREFVARIAKIREYSMADEKARQFARAFGSRSDFVTWDTQGRVRIKDELLEYADLQDDVVMVGAVYVIELWNPKKWEASGAVSQSAFVQAAKYVGI